MNKESKDIALVRARYPFAWRGSSGHIWNGEVAGKSLGKSWADAAKRLRTAERINKREEQ